jgi:hypothetical protein
MYFLHGLLSNKSWGGRSLGVQENEEAPGENGLGASSFQATSKNTQSENAWL